MLEMQSMSDWPGFDADLNDLEARQITVGALGNFYELFWKQTEEINKTIDKMLGLTKDSKLPF